MTFEVKKVEQVGGVREKDSSHSSQMLSISVGVVGCPYADIVANKLVEYTYANTMSVQAVKDGIPTFAASWVATNYPQVA